MLVAELTYSLVTVTSARATSMHRVNGYSSEPFNALLRANPNLLTYGVLRAVLEPFSDLFHRRFSVIVNHQLQIPEYFLVIGRAKIVEAGRVVALEHAIDSCRSVDGADLVGIVLDVDASHFYISVSHCLTSTCLPAFVDLCLFNASEI